MAKNGRINPLHREDEFVYCMALTSDQRLIKIGRSKNPWHRLTRLRIILKAPQMRLLALRNYRDAVSKERAMHRFYRQYRVLQNGGYGPREFYLMPRDVLDTILSELNSPYLPHTHTSTGN